MDRQEMERLTSGTDVKSEKIRILYNAGVERADIARFLDIRYQHVYNVLKNSDMLEKPAPQGMPAAAAAFQVKVEKGRRITIPPDYADRHEINEGDILICREEAGNLVIMSRPAAIEAIREIARKKMPEDAALLEALMAPFRTI